MEFRLTQSWLPIERIEAIVQVEPAIILLVLSLVAWAVYRGLLKNVAKHRHKNLRGLFSNLFRHILFGSSFYLAFWALNVWTPFTGWHRLSGYLGFFALIWGLIIFVKTCRIFAFEYLFFKHMREGVPLLLVNLISLVLSAVLAAWVLGQVFDVKLVPVLATSAIFSLVLGLALQDTLGNLFAGVALQFDKPFDLGDWIEIQYEGQKWVGQVSEVSWRATNLIGFLDEIQTIPNRVISQAQISNYAAKVQPVIRSQIFRVSFEHPIDKVKQALLQSIALVPGVKVDPLPIVLIMETTESWISYKLIYHIEDFGKQYAIADKVISQGIDFLRRSGIELSTQKLFIVNSTAKS